MTEQTGGNDLSQDVMDIFGIGGDEGPSGSAGGDGALPNFGGQLEGEGAAVPPAQAAGTGGEAVSAPASPPAPSEPAPAQPAPQPAAAPTGEPTPPLPGLTPSPAPAAAQPGAAPAAPAAMSPEMELVSLRAQVQMLQQQLAQPAPQGQQPGQQPQAPSPAAAGQGTGGQEEAPRYNLDIPDQVTQAIFNEDPAVAKAGMVHLVNSLATIIHTRAREEFRNEFQQFRTGLQTESVQREQVAEAERLKESYFTTFPAHRDPVVQTIVAAENYALSQEYPGHPFDERYMAALGARVNQKLQGVAGLGGAPAPAIVPPAPAAAAAAPVPARPAPMLPSARTAGGQIPAFEQEADHVADVFSFN